MKRIIFLLIALSGFTNCAICQTKRALIVGIGEYKQGNDWEKIHGDNDIDIIEQMLKSNGFNNSNIVALVNKDATHKNITEQIEAMDKKAKPGDIIYFHFSCHGQQVTDINGDEMILNPNKTSVDLLDEAIVPYDAPTNSDNNYNGELHIIDDYLHEKFEQICKTIGPKGKLIFVCDACHSGGASKGQSSGEAKNECPYRGTSIPLDLPIPKPNPKYNGPTKISFIAILACRENEDGYEYKDKNTQKFYGALSYAIKDYNGESIEELEKDIENFYKKLLNKQSLVIINPTQTNKLF